MPITLKVSAEMVAYVMRFICQEETRYHLRGIFFEPHKDGGVIMVATDGMTLGAIHDDEGEITGIPTPEELRKEPHKTPAQYGFILPISKPMKHALEQLERRGALFCWHEERGASFLYDARHNCDDVDFSAPYDEDKYLAISACKQIEGTFPDWRRVVPPETGQQTMLNFNAEYMARFHVRNYPGVHFFPGKDPEWPGIVRVQYYPSFLGVIMLRRAIAENDQNILPGWAIGQEFGKPYKKTENPPQATGRAACT